jgi:hypothetical protein
MCLVTFWTSLMALNIDGGGGGGKENWERGISKQTRSTRFSFLGIYPTSISIQENTFHWKNK